MSDSLSTSIQRSLILLVVFLSLLLYSSMFMIGNIDILNSNNNNIDNNITIMNNKEYNIMMNTNRNLQHELNPDSLLLQSSSKGIVPPIRTLLLNGTFRLVKAQEIKNSTYESIILNNGTLYNNNSIINIDTIQNYNRKKGLSFILNVNSNNDTGLSKIVFEYNLFNTTNNSSAIMIHTELFPPYALDFHNGNNFNYPLYLQTLGTKTINIKAYISNNLILLREIIIQFTLINNNSTLITTQQTPNL